MSGAMFPVRTAAVAGMIIAVASRAEAQIGGDELMLVRWHGLRALRNASQNTIIFWVIAGMAILAMLVLVLQRRRRRWF
jgi:LPXTG-motif cell wall-anchored protein